MTKTISEDTGKLYWHYPRLAAVVTARGKGKDNAMTAAWHIPLSFSPALYGVSVSPKRFTYQLIVESKEFGINFLPFEAAELLASVGGCSGQEVDKFQRFNIVREKSEKMDVPLLADDYAAYECRLVDDREYGDHRLLVGEIAAVHLTKEAFTPEGVLDLARVNPALYLGNELYLTALKDSVISLEREVYGKR